MRRFGWTLSLLLTVGFYASPAAAQNPKLVMEEFMVPAKDPGLQLYVRNKRPEGMTQFSPEKTVVYVHGSGPTPPRQRSTCRSLGSPGWTTSPAAVTTCTCLTCAGRKEQPS